MHVADQPGATASASKQQRVAVAAHGLRAPPAAAGDTEHAGDVATTGAATTTVAPLTTHDETIHTTTKHPWLTTDRG